VVSENASEYTVFNKKGALKSSFLCYENSLYHASMGGTVHGILSFLMDNNNNNR
jgi:hypothetical protein